MMETGLHVAAGTKARKHLREHGLQLSDIRAMLGASGGPKWLVLNRLDRYLAPRLATPAGISLDLLGTSIGSWRFACYAQNDPLAALDRFEAAYFEQSYSARPGPAEISAECGKILDALLGNAGSEICSNTSRRLHTIADRCLPAALGSGGKPQSWRLGLSALANLAGRSRLRPFYERVLFRGEGSQLPFADSRFGLEDASLRPTNLRQALMATASIPVLMDPVCDIPGTRGGVCVDGGIIDYHFDTPLPYADGIVLYPHFSPRLVPGWFDKLLPWRRPGPVFTDNVVVLSPSADFIRRLPNGRIPDRHDFTTMDTRTRLKTWKVTLEATERLVDALHERLQRQEWSDVRALN